MRYVTHVVVALTAVMACTGMPLSAAEDTYSTDFSEFDAGWFFQDANEALGWFGNGTSGTAGEDPKVDAEIVDLDNNKVLRLSNATTSGNYGQTHAAPPALTLAGESGTGAVNNRFTFSFDFKSATGELQEGLLLTCPTGWESGTASRHGLLYITDDETDGFSIGVWDVTEDGFRFTTLANHLDRTTWHSLEVDMLFVDGPDNDEMTVTLNGQEFTDLTTWEQYYYYSDDPAQPEYAGVDTVIFRAAGDPVESVRGGGVYFDNLSMTSVPEPATMGVLGLGGLGVLLKRKRQ